MRPAGAAAGLLLWATAAGAAGADTEYVVEQVVISVSSAPDGAGERVGQIKSGDAVEVLERQGEEAHVRLAGGQDGWVRASYLSTDTPLKAQLSASRAQVSALTQELDRLKAQLLTTRAPAPPPPVAAVPPRPEDPEDTVGAPPRAALGWQLGALLLALAAGFFLGWRVLDRRIRRKYGGLRIY